jgi:Tfp pilus assembly protein PilZ
MKKRPLVIWIVGIALILAPLYYYAYAETAWSGEGGIGRLGAIPARVGLWNLIGILAAPVVGALVLRVRQSGWYAVVAYAIYTLVANAVTYQQTHRALSRFFLFSTAGIACVLVFLRREIRSPYFNPRLRWWESPARYRLQLGVTIAGRASFSTTTFDISERGCFIATDEAFKTGERVDLTLDVGGASVRAPGSVAWVSDGRHHPKGIGIRFDKESAVLRAELKRYRAREARYEVALPVRLERAGQPALSCVTHDVSATGCYVVTDEGPAPGERVTLAFELASGPVTVPGEVKWRGDGAGQPAGVGVKFLERPRPLLAVVKQLGRHLPERAPLAGR